MEVFGNSVLEKGCRLFTFRADMGGIIGALPLYEVLKAYSGHIKVVTGLHEELELQIDSTDASLAGDDAWYERCDNIYVITGDHEGEEAVFTWHPGEPLGQLKDGLTEMTAVKIKR